MYRLQPVENLDLPDLAPYRSMRWQHEQRAQGIFVAEGEKVVRRLLESQLHIQSLLLPARWAEQYRPLLETRPENLTVYTAEKKLLESLTGFSMYQGVLAIGKIPHPLSFEEALALPSRPRLFLAVDQLSSAENLGGLVRNCLAFGADALIVGETCCSPYLRRAVRSSMGTIFKLPVVESASLADTIHSARQAGVLTVAAHPHTDRLWLHQASLAGDCMIVLGSEGQGISPKVLAACDQAVAIPMHNQVDSLNVGAAGAIFLFEVCRQRRFAGFPMPRPDAMLSAQAS